MENLIFGLGVMVIGLLVVFLGLIILIVFIKVLSFITDRSTGEKKPEKAKPAAPVVSAPPVADPAPAASEGVSAEVWQAPAGFVVRHVKRVSNAPAWNRAGREEQTYSRF